MSHVMMWPVTRHPGGAPSSESRAEPGLGEKWRLEPGLLVTKCNNVTGAGEGWELRGPGSCRSSALSPLLDPVQTLAPWQCPWSAPVLANPVTRTFFIYFSASRPSVQHQYSYIVQQSFISQSRLYQSKMFILGLIFGWSCENLYLWVCCASLASVLGQSKAVMIKTVDTWHLISVTVIRAVTRRVWLWLLNCTLAWESHADAPGHRDKYDNQIMFWCSLLLGIGSLKQSQTINSILVVLMLLYEQNVWAFKLYYAYLILYKRYLMNTLNRGRRQIAKTILAHCTTGLDGLLSNTTTIALLHTYTYLGLEY